MEANIQFIQGLDEKVLPDVRLTRSRDGSTGTATFRFKNPNILDLGSGEGVLLDYFNSDLISLISCLIVSNSFF